MRLEPGEVIGGRYTLVEEVGAGGFGSVWRAVDRAGEPAAIKFLKPHMGGDTARRFVREAAILERLQHPHCVQLHAFDPGDAGGGAWLATEFIEGVTLDAWIGPSRSVAQNVEVSVQIAEALAAAHRVGVIHRDLKPSNVIVGEREGRPHVTVLDFGIGKLLDAQRGDVTATGEVIGTPGYMSPEQLRGRRDIGPPSDMYCLGAVMFAMFEHRPVFGGDSALEISMKHLAEPAPPLGAHVPESVRRIVSRLLAKEPADRPASAEAVIAALRSRPPSTSSEGEPPMRRAQVAAGVIVLVGIGAGVVASMRSEGVAPPPPAQLPTQLTKTTEPRQASSLPEPEPAATPQSAPGCQDAQKGGERLHEFGGVVYLPRKYDGRRPRPLLLLLAEDRQDPDGIMEETDFQWLADEEMFIVGAPDVDRRAPRRVFDFIDEVSEVHCVDEDRVYVVGHGSGGDVLDEIRDPSVFAAAVATSHRLGSRQELGRQLESSGVVPYLLLSPDNDPSDPLEGGHAISLRRHENVLEKEHGCTGRPFQYSVTGAKCQTWDCAVDLTSCVIEGTRHWPDYESKKGVRGAPSKFQHQREIWKRLSLYRRGLATLPNGCGKWWARGERHKTGGNRAYVPKGYDAWERHPVIVALPENKQKTWQMLDELDLEPIADREEFLVFVAKGPGGRWGRELGEVLASPDPARRRFNDAFSHLLNEFCVDERRVYLVGHAGSGPFVQWMGADDRIAAIATFSHRPTHLEFELQELRTTRPYLYVAPLNDDAEPVAGNESVPPLAQYEEVLRSNYHCDAATKRRYDKEYERSACWTWDCDVAEFVSCQIEGGRHWPGYKHRENQSSDFEHQRVLWEFFERHRAEVRERSE